MSVIITVLFPVAKFETPAVVPPLGAQLYVYPGVPPFTVTVAPPVLALQLVAVVAVIAAVNEDVGCVIITVPVPAQEFASLIAMV